MFLGGCQCRGRLLVSEMKIPVVTHKGFEWAQKTFLRSTLVTKTGGVRFFRFVVAIFVGYR